jgi:hypothetical protein
VKEELFDIDAKPVERIFPELNSDSDEKELKKVEKQLEEPSSEDDSKGRRRSKRIKKLTRP